MRRITFAVALLLGSVMKAQADQVLYSSSVRKFASLAGHWPFERSYKDASGNGNDGKVADESAIGWVEGVKGGTAIAINSKKVNRSFVDIPAPIGSIFDKPKGTALVWVKLNPVEGWQAIVERSNLWYLETESNPAQWKDNAVVWRIYDAVAVGGGGTGQIRDNAKITVKDGEWVHLGWTYDGALFTGYVNGKAVITKEYVGGLPPTARTPLIPPADKGPTYNLSVGAWQQRDDWLDGAVDDFVYFTDALSSADIEGLYNAMLAAPAAVNPQGKLTTLWGAVKSR